jgi:hypothetical protein
LNLKEGKRVIDVKYEDLTKLIKNSFGNDKIYGKRFFAKHERFIDEISDNLPKILNGLLPERLTFIRYIQAKYLFIKYILSSGILNRYEDDLKSDLFYTADISKKFIADENNLINLMISLKNAFNDPGAYLKKKYLTEYDFMNCTRIGLSGGLCHRYIEGTLTVGEMLATNPNILLRNLAHLL